MDKPQILEILEILEADNVLPYAKNVQCSCILARWEHAKGSDSKPSMGISINPKGPSLVHCFACGWKGTMLKMVQAVAWNQDLENDPEWDALIRRVSDLEEQDVGALVDEIGGYEDDTKTMSEEVLPEVYLEHYNGLAHPYILKRGFEIETLRQWGVGYDEEQKRVVIPVRNRDGGLVGAVGRGIRKHHRPKYLNYWKFEKGLYLHGEHLLPKDPCRIVVVEGPLDALRVWQECTKAGVEVNVVSLMGAKPTWKQAEKLARYADELVLFLDNDAAGKEGTDYLYKRLGRRMLVTAVSYPDPIEGDPDSLGPDLVDLVREPDLLL